VAQAIVEGKTRIIDIDLRGNSSGGLSFLE